MDFARKHLEETAELWKKTKKTKNSVWTEEIKVTLYLHDGKRKEGEEKKQPMIRRKACCLSNIVEVMLWHGHVWLPVEPVETGVY